jgi:hypothetical protein
MYGVGKLLKLVNILFINMYLCYTVNIKRLSIKEALNDFIKKKSHSNEIGLFFQNKTFFTNTKLKNTIDNSSISLNFNFLNCTFITESHGMIDMSKSLIQFIRAKIEHTLKGFLSNYSNNSLFISLENITIK